MANPSVMVKLCFGRGFDFVNSLFVYAWEVCEKLSFLVTLWSEEQMSQKKVLHEDSEVVD